MNRHAFRVIAATAAAIMVIVGLPAAAAPTCFGKRVTIYAPAEGGRVVGTAGNDVILGSRNDDMIQGGGGNDRICARGGFDQIWGEGGRDRLKDGIDYGHLIGGDGADVLLGLGGGDGFFAGPGDDRMVGGQGWDSFFGEAGDDYIDGGGDGIGDGDPGTITDRDHIRYDPPLNIPSGGSPNPITIDLGAGIARGEGTDTFTRIEGVYGSRFGDNITTAPSGSFVMGIGGNDTVHGGEGRDYIVTHEGDDVVAAAGGDDYIEPGAGNDVVDGGEGELDALSFKWSPAPVDMNLPAQLAVGEGVDTVRWVETVELTPFPDTVVGTDVAREDYYLGDGNDTIHAGGGYDFVAGGNGNDQIYAEDGPDGIWAGPGDDYLSGGGGNDVLVGQEGIDVCTEGEQVDTCEGSPPS